MRKIYSCFLLFALCSFGTSFAQGPNVVAHGDTMIVFPGDTVRVPIKTANFHQIVNYRGSISWDTAVVDLIDIPYYGLPYMTASTFNTANAAAGEMTFNWQHLISIGGTLPDGDSVFVLRFEVVGNIGDTTPVAFPNTPLQSYWFNFAAWSGPLDGWPGKLIIACQAPVSAWADSANNQTISFTDQSGGNPNSYLWDFGDGNTATTANPTHTYANTGNYTVCLITTNTCGSDTVCQQLGVTCNVPGTAFNQSANLLAVNFTDQSTDGPTSWFWDFGDGNTSTMQNPSHTYTTPGNYTVCLTATNVCGTDSSCRTLSVVCPIPTAAFSDSTNLQAAFFTDMTPNNPTGWLWDFGDGNISSLQNPQHTYATPGTYTVCLTTTNSCGSDSSCSTVTVTCPQPAALYSEVITALQVDFTDQTSANPSTWTWDFGDGNTSTMQNPSHTYALPGTYLVCLNVVNACGTDQFCDSVTVSCAAPTSAFTATVVNQGQVDFLDTSTGGATSWAWDFGDGNTSTLQNPQHTYAASGSYQACLVATSICGSDNFCTPVIVTVVGLESGLNADFDLYPNPAQTVVNMSYPAAGSADVTFRIFDISGKMQLSTVSGQADVSALSAGIYLVEMRVDGQVAGRKKLLLK